MDRSFLSDEKVIEISRKFVCIRTATYEDKIEALFLKSTFVGQSGGDLRNFGYCVLAPDGKEKLRRSNRGPNYVYKDSAAMAADLGKIAEDYPGKATASTSIQAVPQMKSVRLGINVASCDGLPSIVVVGKDQKEVDQLNHKLSNIIWDEKLIGKFIYASTTNQDDLKIISGANSKTGILVIEPDAYGMKGKLIDVISADGTQDGLKKSLEKAANNFTRVSKSHGTHVHDGRRNGQVWKTEVPVPNRRRSPNR